MIPFPETERPIMKREISKRDMVVDNGPGETAVIEYEAVNNKRHAWEAVHCGYLYDDAAVAAYGKLTITITPRVEPPYELNFPIVHVYNDEPVIYQVFCPIKAPVDAKVTFALTDQNGENTFGGVLQIIGMRLEL